MKMAEEIKKRDPSQPREKPKRYVYAVKYQGKAEYKGSFNPEILPGLHGVFTDAHGGLKRALVEADKCKRWLGTEIRKVKVRVPNDKPKEEMVTTVHDNVEVWIEQYEEQFSDGYFVKEIDPWAKESEKPASEKSVPPESPNAEKKQKKELAPA